MDVCPFCPPLSEDVIAKNDLCYALWDSYPVNKGHALVIPFRHTPDFFSMTDEERRAVMELVVVCRGLIEENFSPDGYNIGFNAGEAAGQTVFHCHCHVIPRYVGDVAEPRGGVRGVVPERQKY